MFYAPAQDLGPNSPSRRLIPDHFDTIASLTIFLFVDRRCYTKRDLSENLQAIVAIRNTHAYLLKHKGCGWDFCRFRTSPTILAFHPHPAHLSGPVPGFGPVATLAVCSRTSNDLSQRINTSIGSFKEPEVLQCIAPHTENNTLRHPGFAWNLRGRLLPLANSRSIHKLLRNLVKVFARSPHDSLGKQASPFEHVFKSCRDASAPAQLNQ